MKSIHRGTFYGSGFLDRRRELQHVPVRCPLLVILLLHQFPTCIIYCIIGLSLYHSDDDKPSSSFAGYLYIIGNADFLLADDFFLSLTNTDGLSGVQSFLMRLDLSYTQSLDVVLKSPEGVWLNSNNVVEGNNYAISFDVCSLTGDIFVSSCGTNSRERSIDSIHRQNSQDDIDNPFSIILQRLEGNNLSQFWSRLYQTDDSFDVIANSIKVTYDRKYLIIGGTTRGIGTPFGAGASSFGDLDGYITKLSSDDGTEPVETDYESSYELTHTARITSNPLMDDSTECICIAPSNDTFSLGSLYIVGSTQGIMVQGHDDWMVGITRAYIRKFDIDTMNPIWADQVTFYSNDQITQGLGCTLDGSSTIVYLYGNTMPSAKEDNLSQSPDYDSIFIASYTEDNGNELLSRQYLFNNKDNYNDIELVRDGIALDEEGNAFLAGSFGQVFEENATIIEFNLSKKEFVSIIQENSMSLSGLEPSPLSAIQIVILAAFSLISSFALMSAAIRLYKKEEMINDKDVPERSDTAGTEIT